MPTFQNLCRASGNIAAIPGKRFGAPRPNVFGQRTASAKAFRSRLGSNNLTLSGVSRDSSGATLSNCRVMVFRTQDKSFITEIVSDASGVWSLTLNVGGPFFLVEYKAGSPDVAGTSLNTLAPI